MWHRLNLGHCPEKGDQLVDIVMLGLNHNWNGAQHEFRLCLVCQSEIWVFELRDFGKKRGEIKHFLSACYLWDHLLKRCENAVEVSRLSQLIGRHAFLVHLTCKLNWFIRETYHLNSASKRTNVVISLACDDSREFMH